MALHCRQALFFSCASLFSSLLILFHFQECSFSITHNMFYLLFYCGKSYSHFNTFKPIWDHFVKLPVHTPSICGMTFLCLGGGWMFLYARQLEKCLIPKTCEWDVTIIWPSSSISASLNKCCITGQAGCPGRDRFRSVPPQQPDGGNKRSEETGVQGSQVSRSVSQIVSRSLDMFTNVGFAEATVKVCGCDHKSVSKRL